MPVKDATNRFSSRVENYVRFRPSYPPEIIDLLIDECGLKPDWAIADIASGTGIFTRLLLDNGNRVFGVEPNEAMRRAGEEYLSACPRFTSIAGTAEATTLPSASVEMITAAQAAHWFDREKARTEFIRILKPSGWTILIWNERQTGTTPFLRDYERLLLKYGTDYKEVRHERTTDEIDGFFSPSPFKVRELNITQELDYPALEGRLLSSSYTPAPEHPNHAAMLEELKRVFAKHNENGRVALDYTTRVYYGRLK